MGPFTGLTSHVPGKLVESALLIEDCYFTSALIKPRLHTWPETSQLDCFTNIDRVVGLDCDHTVNGTQIVDVNYGLALLLQACCFFILSFQSHEANCNRKHVVLFICVCYKTILFVSVASWSSLVFLSDIYQNNKKIRNILFPVKHPQLLANPMG